MRRLHDCNAIMRRRARLQIGPTVTHRSRLSFLFLSLSLPLLPSVLKITHDSLPFPHQLPSSVDTRISPRVTPHIRHERYERRVARGSLLENSALRNPKTGMSGISLEPLLQTITHCRKPALCQGGLHPVNIPCAKPARKDGPSS